MTDSLRVAMLCGVPTVGHCGVLDYSVQLARRLTGGLAAGRAVRVDLLVNDPSGARARLEGALGEVGTVDIGPGWGPTAVPRILRRLAEPDPYDLVHVQYPSRGYGAGLAPSLLPTALRLTRRAPPLLVTLHEFEKVRTRRRLAAVPLVSGATSVVVTNEPEREFLARGWPGRTSDVQVIRLGSNLEPGDGRGTSGPDPPVQSREPAGADGSDRTEVLSVGTFGIIRPDKSFPSLLRAFAHARRAFAGPARLVVIAEPIADPGLEREVEALLAALDLAPHVVWRSAPTAADAARELAQLDVCVLPYADGVTFRRGSFIAAARLGLPIVTTAGPRVPPELADGKSALLVPAGDDMALAQAITTLLQSPELRAEAGTRARALSELFSWDKSVRQYLDLYGRLVSPRQTASPPGVAR